MEREAFDVKSKALYFEPTWNVLPRELHLVKNNLERTHFNEGKPNICGSIPRFEIEDISLTFRILKWHKNSNSTSSTSLVNFAIITLILYINWPSIFKYIGKNYKNQEKWRQSTKKIIKLVKLKWLIWPTYKAFN